MDPLYTIITNKSACGGKGAMIAMIKGTKSEVVLHYLNLLPRSLRLRVKEITIDLSPSMKLIAKRAFPNATIVSDRFHVQKLMNEAISDLRVDYRWQAIDQENAEISLAKETGRKFKPHVFDNGDTRRQLLARSRHIVMKHFSKWTASQRERAEILFEHYPALEEAYNISMELTQIYNRKEIKDKGIALTLLAKWYDKVERVGCKFFNSVIQTMQNNYATIVNYFDHRSTNASAESFNAKVKAFRAQFRGVKDIPFFIFRLSKLFA
ncbi:MAG: transposase [Alistipes sp.]